MNVTPEPVLKNHQEPLLVTLRLGSARTEYPSHLFVSRYTADPSALAVVAMEPGGFEQNAIVSLYLEGQPADYGCIWVKDYSENEGIWDALLELGLVKRTGRLATSGWVVLHEARLLGALKDAADRLGARVGA